MIRTIISIILIFFFWFMLSGHTQGLLIFLGVISTLITVYLSKRMEIVDHEGYPFHLSLRLMRYYLFLAKEIFLANIDVIKRIIMPGLDICPQVVTLPAVKKTDLCKMIYANSITLTPGTVTLDLSGDEIIVHALTQDGVASLQTGAMARAVPDNVAKPF